MRQNYSHRRKTESDDFVFMLFIIIVVSLLLLGTSMQLPFFALLGMPTPVPVIEEIINVPLNSDAPVYTEQEYSRWVAITISGSVERDGEFFHDALVQYDNEQQSLYDFRGFLIDGIYAFELRAPSPGYSEDHVYRFSHSVNGYLRRIKGKETRAIGFQVINEASRDLEGVFTVEVSSDSRKHKPDAGGR